MVERLLELAARQAQAAEVHLEESESRPIEFENNQLKYVNAKSRRALSLRVIHEGRLGFAFRNVWISETLSAVQRVGASAAAKRMSSSLSAVLVSARRERRTGSSSKKRSWPRGTR